MARRRRSSGTDRIGSDSSGDASGNEKQATDRSTVRDKSRDEIFKQGSLLDLLINILLLSIPALLVASAILPTEMAAQSGCGLLVVMLWLLLFLVWAIRCYLSPGANVRFGVIDLLILGTVTWHSISVVMLVTGETGHARPAINMGWEWIGFGICYFLVRQMFTTYRRQLALLMVMTCLATMLASCAAFQYFHVNPAERNAYRNRSESEKQELLAELGIGEVEKGSRARVLFENRLFSVEPLATFTLTNSLAGFLTPWFIVAFGFWAVLIRYLHLKEIESREIDQVMLIGLSVALLLIVGCLVLTKSRTAWLASGVGVVMILLTAFAKSDSVRRILMYYVGGAVVVLAGFAIWFGALDLDVVRQSPLSLKYRGEYWSATSGMIREHAMFGVGPGNFQSNYMKYQLPQSSEEIRDPHNFLLELAATAGLPAMMMFGLALFFWFWRVFPATRADAEESPDIMQVDIDSDRESTKTSGPPHNDTLLLCGAIIGVGVGFIFALAGGYNPNLQAIIIGLIPAAILSAIFVHYMRAIRAIDTLPIGRWVLAATVALFVNLLASGGIGYPAIGLCCFTLLALGLNVAHERYETVASGTNLLTANETRYLDKTWAGALFIGGTLLAIACMFTAVRPVTISRPLIDHAEANMQRGNMLTPAGSEADPLEQLKKIDPYNSEIQRLRFEQSFRRWANEGFRRTEAAEFEQAAKDLIKSDPRRSTVRRMIAGGYIRAYAAGYPDENFRFSDEHHLLIEKANEHLEAAIELRPNDANLHAQLAWSCQAANRTQDAIEHAERAKQLDELNPHPDRALTGKNLIQELPLQLQIVISNIQFPDEKRPLDAEQWVEVLRNMLVPESANDAVLQIPAPGIQTH